MALRRCPAISARGRQYPCPKFAPLQSQVLSAISPPPSGFRLGAERKVVGIIADDRAQQARLPVSPLFRETGLSSPSLSRLERGSAPEALRPMKAIERLKPMPFYEHVFLTRQDASNAQVDQLTEQFKSVLSGLGGKVSKNEYWGVKSLTFRIKKNRKAHFTLLNIEAPPAAIAEMERQESINEDVIRFMTIRVDALEEGPSAMMRTSRRDDRDR